jgi:hypothetical protein
MWDVYHADGIAREVYWQMLGKRSEADTFECLSWLYDGFELPAASRAAAVRAEAEADGVSSAPTK